MRKLLLLVIVVCSIVSSSSSLSAWSSSIDGPDPLRQSYATAVTLDGSGNIIAAGGIWVPTDATEMIVAKFSAADGSGMWSTVLGVHGGVSFNVDVAYTVAVDANGDVIAGGIAQSKGAPWDGFFFVVKLSGADGTEQWRKVIRGTAVPGDGHPQSIARAIRIDAHGDVLAAGNLVNASSQSDFAVVKLSGLNGDEVWRHTVAHAAPSVLEQARSVSVDANGDVIAAGSDVAVKLSGADGSEFWRVMIGPQGLGAVDANGALVVVEGGDGVPSAVVKRSPVDGTEIWRAPMAPPLAEATSLITDGQGNVVLGGRFAGAEPVLLKLSGASGAELWRGVGAFSENAPIVSLAADANNDLFGAGYVGSQFTVVKVSGADGSQLWREDSQPGQALALLADAQGDVAAGGFVQDGTGSKFTVLKLRGSDGGPFFGGAGVVLTASPTTATPGATVTGTWSGVAAPMATDWIALYAVGTGYDQYLDWKYVGCAQAPTSAFASGSCQFVVPTTLAPGQYELRLFAQESFTLLATSNAFAVGDTTGVSLTVTPTAVHAGDNVNAAWSAITGATATDWLGLYPQGAAYTDWVEWAYVSCVKVADRAYPTGSCQIHLPPALPSGDYVVRLFSAESFALLTTSSAFSVR